VKAGTREKRVLYAGIAIAVVIMIYYAATLFSPGGEESLEERVATQEGLLRRQRELVVREDFYRKRIEEAESGIEKIQARLLPGNNATVGTTELQRMLSEFAEQSGVVITTRSNLQEKRVAESDSLTKVSVRVGLDCTLEDLVDFLIAVKNHDRFLKVEEMAINTAVQQKQMVIRRPLNMIIAGYISIPPPPEVAAKTGEEVADAAAAGGREAVRR